jgi:glycosyltransferase involved in cell wall biosynthesis
VADKKVELSVIIPTYNRAYIISRAIESVLNQTYKDFEILVVDDGSKDNSEAVIKSILDDRIKYIRHEKNKGPAAARNTGIMASKGKYIAFLDSDDEWLPEKLEKQMMAFAVASPQVGIVYVGLLNVVGNMKTHRPPNYVSWREGNLYYELLIDPIIVFPSTAMIRRDCFAKVGMFDENLFAGEDWDLWIRIAKYYHFKFIDEVLAIRTVISDSITASNRDHRNSSVREMILTKHSDDIKRDKRILSGYYVKTGHCYCHEKQLARGRQYFLRAAMTYPFSIGSPVLAYIASLLGQRGYDIAETNFKNFRKWWFSKRR